MFSRESFIVEGGMELANLYHSPNIRWRRAAKVRIHVALCYSVIPATAVMAHKIGKPEAFVGSALMLIFLPADCSEFWGVEALKSVSPPSAIPI